MTLGAATRSFASNPKRHEFQAETRNLMDIVAKSLYSHSEVFVRELISNASDALEKRRCAELSGQAVEGPSEIRITTDKDRREITFEDTGIGMNREDLIECLGTIAKSGSKDFIEKNKDNAEAVIGQFGVGFYSAFMVADSVTVTTRKVDADISKGLRWHWNGDNNYEVSEEDGLPTGTKIVLRLKTGDSASYAEEERIKEVINKYSYFVSSPIILNGERVNSLNAIWTMNPRDVTKEMHENFFKQLMKSQKKLDLFQRALYTIQFQAFSLRTVLYIPQMQFNQLSFMAQQKDCGLALYARRVLIKPDAQELIPHYLRFVVGVVDSEDIPLNLSREMLQNNPVLRKLRKILTDKIFATLQSEMKKDPVKYSEFYKNYSLYFKEGVITEQDQNAKEEVSKLLLFESSSKKAGELTSLGDYVKRMQEDQKEIYYMYANNRQLAESSPYYEVIKSQNREVLFLYDPADEVVFLSLHQFGMKNLVPVEKWAGQEAEKPDEKKDQKEFRDVDKKELLDWLRESLGSVRVNEISGNHRPSEHPVMVTVMEMGAARHFLRTGEIKDMEHLVHFKPHVHVNLTHPLIKSLYKLRKTDKETAQLLAEQVYDNALITAGLIKDTSRMVGRLNKLLTQLAGKGNTSTILTP
ncbi:unnamed protein product [Caenorhabditis auriculariae]|uniref:Histidine kinase/HSP90-like ATPase domain-containing protein n=1 Tax=Caenorhabditis auriculariae TaxID=2777116 RepID=A0A8S1GXK7_9PELO|nr:unnamed protein product [Caenorhabditis auriculariae]